MPGRHVGRGRSTRATPQPNRAQKEERSAARKRRFAPQYWALGGRVTPRKPREQIVQVRRGQVGDQLSVRGILLDWGRGTTRVHASQSLVVVVVAIVVLGLVTAGCRSDAADAGPEFVALPVLSTSPNETAPLAGLVSSETDVPAVIELRIDDGERVRVVVPDPTPGTEHETPVLGLRPDRTVEIETQSLS